MVDHTQTRGHVSTVGTRKDPPVDLYACDMVFATNLWVFSSQEAWIILIPFISECVNLPIVLRCLPFPCLSRADLVGK